MFVTHGLCGSPGLGGHASRGECLKGFCVLAILSKGGGRSAFLFCCLSVLNSRTVKYMLCVLWIYKVCLTYGECDIIDCSEATIGCL